MMNDKLRREAKNEIPVIETNDPYIAWNPITGTSRIVLVHKPRPRLRVGVDLAKGKSETIVVFGRVSKKRVGVLKLRTKTSFEIMGVRKVNPT